MQETGSNIKPCMSEYKTIIDETLDFNKSKQYRMSILFIKSGLSFVILDSQAKKVIAHKYIPISDAESSKEYCFFVNKVLKNEEFLQYQYEKISIAFQGGKSIMVPENLYSDVYKTKFFELNLGLEVTEEIVLNRISQMNSRKLFSVPKCIIELLESNLASAKLFHHTTAIIQNVLKNKLFDTVFVDLNKEFFDIQVFDKSKMLLDNAFKYKSKEDLLYYILYTFEQLDLNPKTQKIILTSSFENLTEEITFLRKYLGELSLANYPKQFNYSYLFSKELSHKIANQILLFECE